MKKNVFKNENPILLDAGANVGPYTQELLKHVGRGKIHSFEPALETYKVLCRN